MDEYTEAKYQYLQEDIEHRESLLVICTSVIAILLFLLIVSIGLHFV